MKLRKENMNLGLTRDEFELVINNSNNPGLIKEYTHKLDNCDLSKSAIELIREEDLASVNRITNEVLLKYPINSDKRGNMRFYIFSISLIALVTGFIFLQKNTSEDFSSIQTLTNKESNDRLKKLNSKVSEPSQTLSKNNKKNPDSINTGSNSPDSLKRPSLNNTENLSTISTSEKGKTKSTKESKKINLQLTDINIIDKRKVRSVKSLKQVPDKYKNEEYTADDLVDFSGGDKNLEKELLLKLKGKIKDTHVPNKNNSIVFKFSVTSNGKIKDLNIQSRVNIELEEIIKETALNLTTWIKGNKKIPVIYTIYITFK